MSRPSRWLIFAAVGLALCRQNAAAQQYIETAEGRAEVIGLKTWTPRMLADSLGLAMPGASLFQTRECAKTLTERLHFSSVFIEKTVTGAIGEKAQSVIIHLVEPRDSARIHWRSEPLDSQPLAPAWRDIAHVLEHPSSAHFVEYNLQPLQVYGLYLRLGVDSALARSAFMQWNRETSVALWTALATHRSPADRELAIRTLRLDGSRRNRMMAAAVLANFPESDDAWNGLAEALRDPYTGVNSTAMHSLTLMARDFARPVDWRPGVETVRAILGGTNIPTFTSFIRVLSQTSVSPSLAKSLLGNGGGELLLAHVDAADRRSHDAALALLKQLNGRSSAGTDWHAWVASL